MIRSSAEAIQGALEKVCSGITVDSRGLFAPDSISFDQAEAVSEILFGIEEVSRFAIGDFLNHCEKMFREEWSQLLGEKLAKRMTTIENWRYACRNVHFSIRREDLGMTAHYNVASLQSQLLQEQLLRIGAECDLSSDEIKDVSKLFREMDNDQQFVWGERIFQNEMDITDLIAAYKKEFPLFIDTPPASQPTSQPVSQLENEDDTRHLHNQEEDQNEYSGARADYDWSEEKDGAEGEEEPGDLVALKTALDELYLATDLETYAKRRITFTRLLAELDQERSEIFAVEGSEVEYA